MVGPFRTLSGAKTSTACLLLYFWQLPAWGCASTCWPTSHPSSYASLLIPSCFGTSEFSSAAMLTTMHFGASFQRHLVKLQAEDSVAFTAVDRDCGIDSYSQRPAAGYSKSPTDDAFMRLMKIVQQAGNNLLKGCKSCMPCKLMTIQ